MTETTIELEGRKPFWGLRKTQSKGMRFDERLIWHYFTYQETWARGKGMFTVCHANWKDEKHSTLGKIRDKPPRIECCAGCYSAFTKRQKELVAEDDL